MGVDTKAIIRKGTTLEEIKTHLEKRYGQVDVRGTSSEGYFQMSFKEPQIIEGAASHRMLSIFYADHVKQDYGIDGVLVKLSVWGSAVEIMKYLLDEFGGYLDENDCDDKDFYPVNIEAFTKSKKYTAKEMFVNKVITELGYENLDKALNLFEEYKTL